MKTERAAAILQSAYIPWKGYFDLVNSVDVFILYDCVQFTPRNWRNRNRIKTHQGPRWLSIPVRTAHRFGQRIEETEVASTSWAERHWKTLRYEYRRARCFGMFEENLAHLYGSCRGLRLSEINERFLRAICAWLGIRTEIVRASDLFPKGERTSKLVDICAKLGATRYLSGPAAGGYLDVEQFRAANIDVSWMSYDGYPEYAQSHPPFEHHVSVLDVLFHTGAEAQQYLLSFSGTEDRAENLRVMEGRAEPCYLRH